jgi:hypothetical protein
VARTREVKRFLSLTAVAVTLLAARASAQALNEPPRAELRVDAIVAENRTSVQGGIGIQIPAGYYARIGIDGALGSDIVSGQGETSGRVDVLARFLFDPFRQSRWGLSAGGGISLRATRETGVRPYMLVALDLEGPRTKSGVAPAFQLGLGGGVRVGMVMRWTSPRVR